MKAFTIVSFFHAALMACFNTGGKLFGLTKKSNFEKHSLYEISENEDIRCEKI